MPTPRTSHNENNTNVVRRFSQHGLGRIAPRGFILAIFAFAIWFTSGSFARADGGLLTCTAVRDGRLIAVFTTPTPPRVGLLDISVLIQDQATGRPLFDVPVAVIARPTGGDKKAIRSKATQEAATNKLMRAAVLDLFESGPWQVEIAVAGASDDPIRFVIDVQAAPPAWFEFSGWIAWPLAAIALFAAHQWLTRRRAVGLGKNTVPVQSSSFLEVR